MGLIVSRQKAYNLTITRRKRVIFYPQKVQGTSNLSISADLPQTTVPLNWKTSSHVLKNTLSIHYKTLQLACISKCVEIL